MEFAYMHACMGVMFRVIRRESERERLRHKIEFSSILLLPPSHAKGEFTEWPRPFSSTKGTRSTNHPTNPVTELLAGLLNEAGEVKILRGGGEEQESHAIRKHNESSRLQFRVEVGQFR